MNNPASTSRHGTWAQTHDDDTRLRAGPSAPGTPADSEYSAEHAAGRGDHGTRGHSPSSVRPPRGLIAHAIKRDSLLEHFRRVYLSLQPLDSPGLPPSVGVTSALSGEGRTTVAAGVASAMAADLDVPVVLVEVDLAHPGIHRMLGIEPEPGISEYLRGECTIGTVVRQVADRLFVLPAGNARGEAPRLIRQLITADLKARLDSTGGVLVFDLPPILDSSYGVLASTMAASLVFVARSGQTTIPQVKEAIGRLDERLLCSLVLNGALPVLPRWLGGK
jgi:Mrp family chromosome partitioning ATPase